MSWADIMGRIPAKLLLYLVGLAVIAFVALVAATLLSLYVTKEPFDIAGLKFGLEKQPTPPTVVISPDVQAEIAGHFVPPGAVMAFTSTASVDDGSCPPGWSPYKEVRGRFIVGAGTTRETWQPIGSRPEDAKFLTNYAAGKLGGEEKHTLIPAEMPSHKYPILVANFPDNGVAPYSATVNALIINTNNPTPGDRTADYKGEGNAHSIVPPYIALYYCVKK